jgi:hypothetical protein
LRSIQHRVPRIVLGDGNADFRGLLVHEIPVDMPTRKERIRGLDTHFHLVLSWAARGGDAECGKLVNEIVGIAGVINDLYADPRPMLPK